MKRNGKKLMVLPDGHPRRLSDGRNAWKKMDDSQRSEFLQWILENVETDRRKLPAENVIYSNPDEHGKVFVSCVLKGGE